MDYGQEGEEYYYGEEGEEYYEEGEEEEYYEEGEEGVDPLIGLTINFVPTSAPPPDQAPRGGVGSQVLPVADLDDDWEEQPSTGEEYLFLVRKELKALDPVTRVDNPYKELEREGVYSQGYARAKEDKEENEDRPSESWRKAFLAQFVELRERLAKQSPPLKTFPPVDPTPPHTDKHKWATFINGKLLTTPPQPPTLEALHISSSLPSTTASQPLSAPIPETNGSATEKEPEMSLEDSKAALLAALELDTDDAPPALSSFTPTPSTFSFPSSSASQPSTTAPTYDPSSLPHFPTPALLLSLNLPTTLALLRYFDHWFRERIEIWESEEDLSEPSTTFVPRSTKSSTSHPPPEPSSSPKPLPLPTSHELQWILSLLSHLPSLLESNHISHVRELTKTIKEMIRISFESAGMVNGKGKKLKSGVKWSKEMEDRAEVRAAGWMVVVVVAGVWGQKDLLWEGAY